MMKEKADKDDFDMEMESDQMTTTHGVLNMGNRHAREANLHENGHESGGQASAGEDAMGRHVSFMGVDDGLLNEADFMAAWDEDDSGNEM
jgi:hypothetical protein